MLSSQKIETLPVSNGVKVILLQNIDKLGKKYDIKNVADGHARNFLMPQGLVKPATQSNMNWLKKQKESDTVKEEEELQKTQTLASSLDGFELNVPVKVGEKGELFESISAQKILEKLKENGFDSGKIKIALKDPIKEIGEYPVKITFPHNLEVEINVIITEEKS